MGTAIVGRSSKETLLALWCGLFVQTLAMQVLSAILPLYPWGLIAMPCLALIVLAFIDRRQLPEIPSNLVTARTLATAHALLAIAVAYIATRTVIFYDSGLYHIPLLRWLARDGLVPGLGLLHIRFAIPSDWFAIASVFDAGPFRGRMAAAVNGYVILLAAAQMLMAASRISSDTMKVGDALVAGSFGLLIVHAVTADTAVSVSPDLPVAVLTILIGWLMSKSEPDAAACRSETPILIAFLAAMSVAIKPSAAPIMTFGVLFCFWHLRHSISAQLFCVIVVVGVLIPTIYASIILSGCPAFPLTTGCLALPWTIAPSSAKEFQDAVTHFARWYAFPAEGKSPWDWIIPYFLHSGNRLNLIFVPLALLVVGVELSFPALRRAVLSGNGIWILGLALSDFCFVMIEAPDARFAIGAIALLFGQATEAVATSFRRQSRSSAVSQKLETARGPLIPLASVSALAIVGYRLVVVDRLDERRWAAQPYAPIVRTEISASLGQRWLLPPRLPVIYGSSRRRDGTILELTRKSTADVNYGMPPLGDQCWGADDPCSPSLVAPVRLRPPARGPDGGFVHDTP